MQHEVKKVALIINELITLLLLNEAEEVDINVKYKKDASEITIIHYNCKYDEEFIDNIRFKLNVKRQCEVEGYYWQLVGEDDNSDELHLVGAMIDEVEIYMKENDLYIHLIRKK